MEEHSMKQAVPPSITVAAMHQHELAAVVEVLLAQARRQVALDP
jgi:Na+-transporting methylmalonyl-CoA/oxaloacetate decarboxylase gamma subunit